MFKIRGRREATIKECASSENVPANNDVTPSKFPATNHVTPSRFPATNDFTFPATNDVTFHVTGDVNTKKFLSTNDVTFPTTNHVTTKKFFAPNDVTFPTTGNVTTKNTNDVMFPASENATTNRLRAVASSFHVANPRNLNIFRSFRRSEVVGGSVENIPNRTNRLLQSLRMRHKT